MCHDPLLRTHPFIDSYRKEPQAGGPSKHPLQHIWCKGHLGDLSEHHLTEGCTQSSEFMSCSCAYERPGKPNISAF